MKDKIILLVEDNPDDEALTLRSLSQCNVVNKIFVARDGVEALDFLFCTGNHKHRDGTVMPQLMLLDVKLPKLDGIEVLKRVRADSRTKMLPVVILTSSKDDQDVMSGDSLGINSYIRKPVDFTQFAEAVRQLQLYWLILNKRPVADEHL